MIIKEHPDDNAEKPTNLWHVEILSQLADLVKWTSQTSGRRALYIAVRRATFTP